MLTRVGRKNYVSHFNIQFFVLKMTLKRRRKSILLEGSPERSTMEENITINTKNKKKLTKLSSTSSELVSSYMSQPHTVSLLATFASTTSSELVKRRNRGAFTTAWILLLTILNLVSSSSSASSKTCFYFYFRFISLYR